MKLRNKFEDNLDKQLEMNKITYSRLMDFGLKNNSDVELDFCFLAPNEAQGILLADSLKRNSKYNVETGYSDASFIIQGKTDEIPISLEVINSWVVDMCARGQEHDCLFDGWGASV